MKARELAACYVLGTLFGVVLVQGEIVSWFRIHEMFRFEAFHMYGVIGSALAVSATSLWMIRRFGVRTLSGDRIVVPQRLTPGASCRVEYRGTSWTARNTDEVAIEAGVEAEVWETTGLTLHLRNPR